MLSRDSASMAIGTSCTFCSRFCAVTTTSSSVGRFLGLRAGRRAEHECGRAAQGGQDLRVLLHCHDGYLPLEMINNGRRCRFARRSSGRPPGTAASARSTPRTGA